MSQHCDCNGEFLTHGTTRTVAATLIQAVNEAEHPTTTRKLHHALTLVKQPWVKALLPLSTNCDTRSCFFLSERS